MQVSRVGVKSPAAKTNLDCFLVFQLHTIQLQAARGGRQIQRLAPLSTCIGHLRQNGLHLNQSSAILGPD